VCAAGEDSERGAASIFDDRTGEFREADDEPLLPELVGPPLDVSFLFFIDTNKDKEVVGVALKTFFHHPYSILLSKVTVCCVFSLKRLLGDGCICIA
jgi:hypothetical protein